MDCPVRTNRAIAAATRRASAASGSASITLASSRSHNRDHGNEFTYGVTWVSTHRARSRPRPSDRNRAAILRAFHASTEASAAFSACGSLGAVSTAGADDEDGGGQLTF